jgi:hypothetical protein
VSEYRGTHIEPSRRSRLRIRTAVIALALAAGAIFVIPAMASSPTDSTTCVGTTPDADGNVHLDCVVPMPPAVTVTVPVPGPTFTTTETVTLPPVTTTTTVTQTVTETVTMTPTPPPTTPPPTTSPPSPPGAYPNATNRGVPAGTTLTNDSRCTLATAGEVIVGKHFGCRLSVSASNVVIRNSQLDRGINNWTSGGGHSFVLEDSTVGTTACVGDFGVGATDFVARRVKVIGFSDGFRLSGRTTNPIVIDDSYARTCHLSGAHSDGAQGDGSVGTPVTIHHSTIDIRPSATDWTAAIFFPTAGALTLADNILAGGGWAIDVWGNGPHVVSGNKIVDGSWEYQPSNSNCGAITWTGNTAVTLDAAGQPATTVRAVACG